MSVEITILNAKKEIENKRFWRAKEILQGAINNFGYDVNLYFAFGELLFLMGDLVEAGKYLFLSGSRESKFIESIDIYKSKFNSNSHQQLYSSFPSRAQLNKLSDYPQIVMNELKDMNFPEILNEADAVIAGKAKLWNIIKYRVLPILLLLLVLTIFALGIFKIFEVLFN